MDEVPYNDSTQSQRHEEYLQAAVAAEELAAELRAKEERLLRQQEEYATMQVSLGPILLTGLVGSTQNKSSVGSALIAQIEMMKKSRTL